MKLRIGTRGSDLALAQTRTVCSLIQHHHPQLTLEEVVIRTHGDAHAEQPVTDADWPIGGFVGAIEQALLAGDIDIAVHSYKDLPARETPGLAVVAVPKRGPVHDVLVTREAMTLDAMPRGLRIGTSSPRRAAQIRQFGDVEVVPIRGNVPMRLEKLDRGEFDGIVLAAAGLHRLGISPAHTIDLPLDRCLPAPGQGALAVQMREDDSRYGLVYPINDDSADGAVSAERSVLYAIGAGCATPLAALATEDGHIITMRGQLFDASGAHQASDAVRGDDPEALGRELAERLVTGLDQQLEHGA